MNNFTNFLEYSYFLKTIIFSSDFLELNIINIIILIFCAGYLVCPFFISVLEYRQKEVISIIRDTEKNLYHANMKFFESERDLFHIKLYVNHMKEEANLFSKKSVHSIFKYGVLDLEKRSTNLKTILKKEDLKMRNQLKKDFFTLILKKVSYQLQNSIDSDKKSNSIDVSLFRFRHQV